MAGKRPGKHINDPGTVSLNHFKQKGPPPLTTGPSRLSKKQPYEFPDPESINKIVQEGDRQAYARSRSEWEASHPGLGQGLALGQQAASQALSGGRDAVLDKTLANSGLGNMDFGAGGKLALNEGITVADKDKRDRGYFEAMMSNNALRPMGLTSDNLQDIAAQNSMGTTELKNKQALNEAAQLQGRVMSEGARNTAIASAVGGVISSGIKAYRGAQGAGSGSPSLSAGGYGSASAPPSDYSGGSTTTTTYY